MKSSNRFPSGWFRSYSDSRSQRRRSTALMVEQLEGRNLLSVSPIAYKTGGYYDSVDVNGIFYFSTTAGELWKTDGTPGGTALVKDLNPQASSGAGPSEMTNVNGMLFFQFKDPANGRWAIWKSDGTSAGTIVLKDLDLTSFSYNKSLRTEAAVNGDLFFVDEDFIGSDAYLWKSDGTVAGTVMVKKLTTTASRLSIANLTEANGTLFFTLFDSLHLTELWKSDGTAAGTVPVRSDIVGVDALINVNGKLAFISQDFGAATNEFGIIYMQAIGQDLWITDGSDNGTLLLKHFDSSRLDAPVNVKGSVYITDNSNFETKLWKSDGSAAGTLLVEHFPEGFSIEDLTDVNGTLYFVGHDASQIGLWKSDGTEAGTTLIKALGTWSPFYVSQLTNVNGKLYFSLAMDNQNFQGPIRSLWVSDGTESGTTEVPETSANPVYSVLWQLTSVNGNLFFVDLANTGPTNIQGLIVGKVDDGNGPPSNPLDLSTLDRKTINDPPPEPGLVWPPDSPPTAPIPDAFSVLLIPAPQSPELSPQNIPAGRVDDSNIQISLAITSSPGPAGNQSSGSSYLSESILEHAQSSNPFTTSSGLSSASTNSSNQFLIRSLRGSALVADDGLSTADLDSFFALDPSNDERALQSD
jgi:ELWxxDGT repeat protein